MIVIPTHPAYEQTRAVTTTASVVVAENPSPVTLDGTNTWVLRARPEGPCVVVDPGPDTDDHLDAVLRAAGDDIALILLTHRHLDHTAGLDALVARSGAPARAFDTTLLRGGGDRLVAGETIEVAGLRIVAVCTPGHTSDSMSFVLPDAVLTGDTVLGRGTTMLDHPDGTLRDYLQSLRQLREFGTGRALLPGHGPDHPELAPVAGYYLAHREQRLEQIRAVLRDLGPAAAIEDVVRAVYPDLDPQLWPAAASSVQAQWRYLRDDPQD